MSEWLKEHAWKACVGETLPRVRIPLSPPIHKPRNRETGIIPLSLAGPRQSPTVTRASRQDLLGFDVGVWLGAPVAKANAARAPVAKRQTELSLGAGASVTTEVRAAQREVETNEKGL